MRERIVVEVRYARGTVVGSLIVRHLDVWHSAYVHEDEQDLQEA